MKRCNKCDALNVNTIFCLKCGSADLVDIGDDLPFP
jgi:hypothetical protein